MMKIWKLTLWKVSGVNDNLGHILLQSLSAKDLWEREIVRLVSRDPNLVHATNNINVLILVLHISLSARLCLAHTVYFNWSLWWLLYFEKYQGSLVIYLLFAGPALERNVLWPAKIRWTWTVRGALISWTGPQMSLRCKWKELKTVYVWFNCIGVYTCVVYRKVLESWLGYFSN